MNVVAAPTREMLRFVGRVDAAIAPLIAPRSAALGTEWEAPRHAWCLSNLTLRHAEAVLVLARTDTVLVPSAWVSARAAMEAAARSLWLMEPDDPWDRERRWLVFVDEGERFHERVRFSGVERDGVKGAAIADFAARIRALLPPGEQVHGIPSTTVMLTPYGDHLPRLYALASQYVHGADLAITQWRTGGLGTSAAYGEAADVTGMATAVWVAWEAFRATALQIASKTGVDIGFDIDLFDHQIRQSRDQLLEATPGRGTWPRGES